MKGGQADRFCHAGFEAPRPGRGPFDQVALGSFAERQELLLGSAGRSGATLTRLATALGIVLIADRGPARGKGAVAGHLGGALSFTGDDDHLTGSLAHPDSGVTEAVGHRVAHAAERDGGRPSDAP